MRLSENDGILRIEGPGLFSCHEVGGLWLRSLGKGALIDLEPGAGKFVGQAAF